MGKVAFDSDSVCLGGFCCGGSMMPEYYAHSLPGRPKEEWQRLEDHLKNVAEMRKTLV
jgi:hypothetical protein